MTFIQLNNNSIIIGLGKKFDLTFGKSDKEDDLGFFSFRDYTVFRSLCYIIPEHYQLFKLKILTKEPITFTTNN